MLFFTGGTLSAATTSSLYGDEDGFGIGATHGNTFNWTAVGSTPDVGTITDAWIYNNQSWTQTYSLVAIGSIASASLDLFVGGIGAQGPGTATVWVDSMNIGSLTVGDGPYLNIEPLQYAWLDSFNLMPFLSALTDGSVLIEVRTSSDGWSLDYSKLTISDDMPVPEPATILLLGSGFVSFVAARRRFKK